MQRAVVGANIRSQLFTVATGVDQAVMTRLGLGQHASTISPASLEKYTFVRRPSLIEDTGKGPHS